MKLNLAISSFGGQYWNNCYYALGTRDLSSIVPAFNSGNRYCGGPGATATTAGELRLRRTPAGLTFIENANFRTFPTTCSTCTATEEGVAPNLKPYNSTRWFLASTISSPRAWPSKPAGTAGVSTMRSKTRLCIIQTL